MNPEPTDDQIRLAVANTMYPNLPIHYEENYQWRIRGGSYEVIPDYVQSIDAIRNVVLREDEEFQRKFAKAMTDTALVMHCCEHSIPPNEWCLIYLELKGVKL